jgi:hypothetical protein
LAIPIDEWFFPYVQNWLDAAEKKTSEWVQSAIKADKVTISILTTCIMLHKKGKCGEPLKFLTACG